MKITNLDGSITRIVVNPNDYLLLDKECCSSLEYVCGQYLQKKYRFDVLLQHFIIPNTNGMHLDFFLINRGMAIEIDGLQHNQAVPFWGGDVALHKQKQRDDVKGKWCYLNNIVLIRVTNEQELVNI